MNSHNKEMNIFAVIENNIDLSYEYYTDVLLSSFITNNKYTNALNCCRHE